MKSLTHVIERAMLPRPKEVDPTTGLISDSDFLVGHQCRHGSSRAQIALSWRDRRKHIYALGSSGCGKSNLLVRMVGDDIARGRNAVVVDLRGDLIDRLIRRLEPSTIQSGRIHLLDFRPEDRFVPFNPLIGTANPYRRALHLLEVIHQGAHSWGVQIDETLRFSLVALSQAGGSLLEVESLLTDPSARSALLRKCSDEQVKRFFARFDQLSPERQSTWALPVLNKLSHFWSVPQIRAMLQSRASIDWHDWIDQPGHVVLIALAAHRSPGVAQTVGGLIVASLQDAVMSRADDEEEQRVPLTLYIDEFETMATPTFNTIIAEGRRFGLSLFLAHQNLGQLENGLRQAIRASVQTNFFFQCSSTDASDLANDIGSTLPRERLRRILANQPVGTSFLSRRGQASVQVATIHSPDPAITKAELAERAAHLQVGQLLTSQSVTETLSMEVRHERCPYLP
ncbi:MAG: type IV secretion system DNA-binding domain-containing protein [Fimbriimonadaceae bacterium]|nr:type IV secretion system DNA-binding domain-containing protein [Fimbriimonadaceae bacterium]QYK59118.1 MAG: type IV secretion system DNA-binding domain-containing protein [Fimbriimonadaceae bacterium]